ncbi:hypothetical protein MARCHEWKA_01500 [Brevundimonas phage vB_BpoS-Marchewka]|uniref:Uncharacterized protein n=1 Tax=Brevundimonas phage vB_BpoS-Marchewka TaxID=2948604 RepID=A0A9E7N4I8_9CAUD|nr:hypothetical protein MARCHEWKA_01500 [Brevundimonas phage vB_BpoS-Marchewka]UTC29109.1 hypothetical protein BAMBUS_00260 [Brevundimonas phage vB_BpoS-Bambus]
MPAPIHLNEISANLRTAAERTGPTGAFSVIDWTGVVDPDRSPYQVVDQGEADDNFDHLSAALRRAEHLALSFDIDRLESGGLSLSDAAALWEEHRDGLKATQTSRSDFILALVEGQGVLSRAEATVIAQGLNDPRDASVLGLSPREYDAAMAGLRLLARELAAGRVAPDDNDIGQILTNGMEHPGLSAEQIHDLADAWQAGERDIAR